MRTKAAVLLLAALSLSACQRNQKAAAPASSAASSAAMVQATPPAPPPYPLRKPGLWEMRTSIEGFDRVQRATICITRDTDRRLAVWGAQGRGGCGRNTIERQPDGSWHFASTCSRGSGGTVTTSGTVTGDLSSRYVVSADVTTTGAGAPQMNGQRRITIEVQRLGECAPGQKGGDMTDGRFHTNLLDVGG